MGKERGEGDRPLLLVPAEAVEDVSGAETVVLHLSPEEALRLRDRISGGRGFRLEFRTRAEGEPPLRFSVISVGRAGLEGQVVRSLNQGLLVLDEQNRALFVNPKMGRLLGLPSEGELLGNRWRKALSEDLMRRLEVHLGGGPFAFEATVGGVPVMVNGVPWTGPGRGTVLLFVDISPLKAKERELMAKVQELEDTKRAMLHLLEQMEETKQKLEWLSITDDLTGLYNRRYFYRILAKEMEVAERYGLPLSLIVMDLDDFKDYNDTYGHVEGDRALKRFAEVLQGSIRRGVDSAYRLGGDEFAVIAPGSTFQQAAKIAERVQEALEGLSLSLGIAQFREGMDTDSFISQADEKMYEEKRRKKASAP